MPTEIIPADQIRSRILFVRGHRVLLDADLAKFYGVPTHRFNEAVKRNEKRFPSDFRFQLTREEVTNLISQFAISSYGGRRKLPWAFTEHGALMAANVLNSDRAAQVSVVVIRAFMALQRLVMDQKALAEKLQELESRIGAHDEQLAAIVDAIRQIVSPSESEHNRKIGFHRGNR